MKLLLEETCCHCDATVHGEVDAEAFWHYEGGVVICPCCGRRVMPCNECLDHSRCDKCPYIHAATVKGTEA